MEQEAGRPLERFFSAGSTAPRFPASRSATALTGTTALLRLEQAGPLFDLPVAVTLQYADGTTADVVIPLTDRSVETRVPLRERASCGGD